MLTIKQTAEKLGVSKEIVYCWVSRGELPHHRLGRSGTRGVIRISEQDLEVFVQSRRRESGALVVVLPRITKKKMQSVKDKPLHLTLTTIP